MIPYEYFWALKDFSLLEVVNCFVDEFNNLTPRGQMLTLKMEPMRGQGTKKERAFYAALCEFYSNWYHLPQPKWMFKPEYYLDEEWYPYGNQDREYCPKEFRSRNIIIGKNDVINC